MQSRILRKLSVISVLSLGLWACGTSTEGGSTGGTQGSGGVGSGGTGSGGTGSGGTGSGGTGSGGKGSGGTGSGGTTTDTGGKTTAGSGGKTGSGGAAGAGEGGSDGSGGAAGGRTGTVGRDGGMGSPDGRQGSGGGTGTVGGSTGTAGTGGGGSTGSGDCVKGQTAGKNVAVVGESFIAMSHGLTKELEALAVAAGSLKSGEHYVDESISGTWISQGNDSIPNQYKRAQEKNDIKYVVMDGGGNDCMNGGTGDPIITAATAMYKQMGTDGVLKAVYFWMPDPIGSNWNNLKSCLDATRPKLKAFCESQTSPKCYFVDLKESWDGHKEYTSDGIHPTAAGDKASAKQIWDVMVKNCVAQ